MKTAYNLVKINVFLVILLLFTAIQVKAIDLKIKILDSATGKTIPARVLIKNGDGESFLPEKAVTLQIGKEIWFVSPGTSNINITSDKVLLRVERGKEYQRIKKEIDLSGKDSMDMVITLKRWINMKARGYLSSENHIHHNCEETAAMCAAEDMDFGTSLQWWNRPRFGVPEGTGNIRNIPFGGVTVPIAIYNAEKEDDWGALYVVDLPNPFPFVNNTEMPNLIAAQYGREKGALNCYQSGWSREVLPDALLGTVDVVNVCNNNFHMHRYQPRSRYSNLLNVKGFPVYPNTPEGMMQMNTDTYYRLLNCGLKLAAGAGSASGAKEVPVGYNRTYVRCSPKEGIKGFFKAWREGENFVTNGPMLFLETTDGLKPGDSLSTPDSKKITLKIEAVSDSPLTSVEIVVNGKVIKSFPLKKGTREFKGKFSLIVSRSSWICARCTDKDILLTDQELAGYKSPRVQLFQDPNRLRYAHTSPVYFYIDGKGIAVKKSIEEGLRMMETFKQYASENAGEKYKKEILTAIEEARKILAEKLKYAR